MQATNITMKPAVAARLTNHRRPQVFSLLLRQILGCLLCLASRPISTSCWQQQQFIQHNNVLNFNVLEGLPNNTYVGNIRAQDGSLPWFIVPVQHHTPDADVKAAFRINLTDGDMFTNSVLDREYREVYHFVAVTLNSVEIKCYVTVKDINDNAPLFLPSSSPTQPIFAYSSNQANESHYIIEVPEGQRGIRRQLPMAVDYDSPTYGIKEFRIISGNTPSGTFGLVEHGAPSRSANGLDGQQSASTNDDFNSNFLSNENPQMLLQYNQQSSSIMPAQPSMQSSYVLSSSQSQKNYPTPPGSPPTNVASNGAPTSSKFEIDLEVVNFLDRENQSSYQLVVEAVDGGKTPLMGRLYLTVNVMDVNDNDPIFNKLNYDCWIREDAAKGSLLLAASSQSSASPACRVEAHDADPDENGRISYYIKRISPSPINQNTANNQSATIYQNNSTQYQQRQQQASKNGYGSSSDYLFDINTKTGEIFLINQLDYEVERYHDFQVEARDNGRPSRSSYAYVRVNVEDVMEDTAPSLPLNRIAQTGRSTGGSQQANAGPTVLPTSSNGQQAEAFNSEMNMRPKSIFQFFNFNYWLDQINSATLFFIVLIALFSVAFLVCLVKVKSTRKSEPDHYNDTAGLTLNLNNQSAKQSPNHSLNLQDHLHPNHHSKHHHHHMMNGDHHHTFRSADQAAGLGMPPFDSGSPQSAKQRYQCIDSNLYHNPYATQHYPSHHHNSLTHPHHNNNHNKGGTMISLGTHHSAHPSASPATPNTAHSSGLPHLNGLHEHHLGTGNMTMENSMNHHSVPQQPPLLSGMIPPIPQATNGFPTAGENVVGAGSTDAIANAAGASGSTVGLHHHAQHHLNHHSHHHHSHRSPHLQTSQDHLQPPTPCNAPHNSFSAWPHGSGSSRLGCGINAGGTMATTCSASAAAAAIAAASVSNSFLPLSGKAASCATLDRWLVDSSGIPTQLIYSNDWCGSYNWDYLTDWKPSYEPTLMQLFQATS